jgi:hypothetical protein
MVSILRPHPQTTSQDSNEPTNTNNHSNAHEEPYQDSPNACDRAVCPNRNTSSN